MILDFPYTAFCPWYQTASGLGTRSIQATTPKKFFSNDGIDHNFFFFATLGHRDNRLITKSHPKASSVSKGLRKQPRLFRNVCQCWRYSECPLSSLSPKGSRGSTHSEPSVPYNPVFYLRSICNIQEHTQRPPTTDQSPLFGSLDYHYVTGLTILFSVNSDKPQVKPSSKSSPFSYRHIPAELSTTHPRPNCLVRISPTMDDRYSPRASEAPRPGPRSVI